MDKSYISRRQFLKYSGAGIAGLGLSTLNLPFMGLKKAPAAISDQSWQFGVMADTQWKSWLGGHWTCATGIIDALNDQFIRHGCKFVIQVGDLVNDESIDLFFTEKRTLPVRAEHARDLYDAGIGFFPVRGNHESSARAAGEIRDLFPQTRGLGKHVFGARNFQKSDISGLEGLSYAFDYKNVRCVLLDQFCRADGTNYKNKESYDNNILDQIDWTEKMLMSNGPGCHTFVFAHKNLEGQNHKDTLLGRPASNVFERDRFIKILCDNRVGYYMSGHDHMHHRSLVSNSLGDYKADQVICASNSYKFYVPVPGDSSRETPLQQELFTIGYYIVTVDGPRVTVDFYSSSHGQHYGDVSLTAFPNMTFYLRERFGYSLNGERYEVGQGESYTQIASTYKNKTAKILDGINSNTKTDSVSRNLSKTVNTGWADSSQLGNAASSIFTLWGLADNLSLWAKQRICLPNLDKSQKTDQYTLSLAYDPGKIRASEYTGKKFVLAARDENNQWVNAVTLNYGGTPKFRRGPWQPGDTLGTFGMDPHTETAWAVLNHETDFVVRMA